MSQETWVPSTDAEKSAVLEQLERVLQNPHFHKSRRFPLFLRFVVGEALAGRSGGLKERTLGIEVFGKNPEYDTTDDPIVRVTAGEIRKRIAQYYQEPGHEGEIKLVLPSGSYVPLFYPPDSSTLRAEMGSGSAALQSRPSFMSRPSSAKLLLIPVLLAATVLLAWKLSQPSPLSQFWAPFFKSPDPVLFCVADQSHYSTIMLRDATDPKRQTTLNDHMVTVIIDDLSPLINIAGMLNAHGRSYRVQGESVTSFTDLRAGPSIFIGAFDNAWTLRLTSPLRFHFGNNADMTQFWIEDRDNPGNRNWLLQRTVQNTGSYRDFAIITRELDPSTGRYMIVAAGIARGGTIAAGEFLVDGRYMDELATRAPKEWPHKNMQIVLETQVIDGLSGPPRIQAVHLW